MHTLYIREGETFKEATPVTILEEASRLVEKAFTPEPSHSGEPAGLRGFLRLKLQRLEHEIFALVLLDAEGEIIDYVEIFRGTIDSSSIYPREVVKEAMRGRATDVILVHNHPSGTAEPSQGDKLVTRRLRDALALVDIGVRDHLIVGDRSIVSFAERGLL